MFFLIFDNHNAFEAEIFSVSFSCVFKILKKKARRLNYKSERYLEINMPGANEKDFEKVTKNNELQIVADYGTDKEEIVVTGDHISTAYLMSPDPSMQCNIVGIDIDQEGTKRFAGDNSNYLGKKVSILWNGQVISNPMINVTITCTSADMFFDSEEDAEKALNLIRAASTKFELEEEIE